MRLAVHSIPMGDVEDPEVYAAEPIMHWEKTEQGQWLHEHSTQHMEFLIRANTYSYGWVIIIFAWLEGADLTYYNLKWGDEIWQH